MHFYLLQIMHAGKEITQKISRKMANGINMAASCLNTLLLIINQRYEVFIYNKRTSYIILYHSGITSFYSQYLQKYLHVTHNIVTVIDLPKYQYQFGINVCRNELKYVKYFSNEITL